MKGEASSKLAEVSMEDRRARNSRHGALGGPHRHMTYLFPPSEYWLPPQPCSCTLTRHITSRYACIVCGLSHSGASMKKGLRVFLCCQGNVDHLLQGLQEYGTVRRHHVHCSPNKPGDESGKRTWQTCGYAPPPPQHHSQTPPCQERPNSASAASAADLGWHRWECR